ncbi:hypothetical protein [Amycolatopsis circi]|uniref:hypothetical protein n=1 Tax=Amycolatopsis circi TaxID=871959 RepID=UPI000E26A653|nr:hypothetical protein [Amycolatopsis circi]
MLEAFVILGGIVIVLLAAGLIVDSKDLGRKGKPNPAGRGHRQARRDAVRRSRQSGAQRGYLFLSQPWS